MKDSLLSAAGHPRVDTPVSGRESGSGWNDSEFKLTRQPSFARLVVSVLEDFAIRGDERTRGLDAARGKPRRPD